MVTVHDVQAVPQSQWSWRSVRDVMEPRNDDMEVAPSTSAVAVLEQMLREERGRLAVVQDGLLVGLVTRSGIGRFLQLRGLRR
jgi:CBS domain-containing protein